MFEPDDVAAYKSAVDQIRRVAMTPSDSLDLMTEIDAAGPVLPVGELPAFLREIKRGRFDSH